MGRKNIKNLEYPLRPVLHCDKISVPELTHSPDLEINESMMDCPESETKSGDSSASEYEGASCSLLKSNLTN